MFLLIQVSGNKGLKINTFKTKARANAARRYWVKTSGCQLTYIVVEL